MRFEFSNISHFPSLNNVLLWLFKKTQGIQRLRMASWVSCWCEGTWVVWW
jgi:hypothetical protein